MGNRLRTTYYTRKVALVEPVCTTIPGTDNLQEYNIVSYAMLGNKRYVRYNDGDWFPYMVINTEGYVKYFTMMESYPYYYIKDHLGSVRQTYMRPTSTNKFLEQEMQYYPSGLPWDTNIGASEQPFKYGSKEFIEMHGLDEYDSEARWYYPAIMRTTSMDPLCEKYYSTSPYAWCANNPVNFVDPNGASTLVVQNADSSYTVVGGNLLDYDRNIYLCVIGEDGNYIQGNSIGITTSISSFYDSDSKVWTGTINPNDLSGDNFLNDFLKGNTPTLFDYMFKANNDEFYDFKISNGTFDTSDDNQDVYRGMPIGQTSNGQVIYSSARDIGNIAAGYIAGIHGISWLSSRLAFDFLQTRTAIRKNKRFCISIEGISSRNAQYYGWRLGMNNSSPVSQSRNIQRSLRF